MQYIITWLHISCQILTFCVMSHFLKTDKLTASCNVGDILTVFNANICLKHHNSYLGVIGLIPPANTLRKRTGFPLDEGKAAMPELPAFKELVKGLSSRLNNRPLGGTVLWQLSRWIGVLSTKHQFLKSEVSLAADDGAVVIQHTYL